MTELLPDPIAQLRNWYADAERATPHADVVALATASVESVPSVRMVNFKGWRDDQRGTALSFFSNYESRKGHEIAANPRASILFYWAALNRQVQVEGECIRMSDVASQAYFATRDREAQLSAWMSQQSREMESFEHMEDSIEVLRTTYRGRDIPCPSYWGGYLLYPQRIEFRIGREHRRHYRWEYVRDVSGWRNRKLYP